MMQSELHNVDIALSVKTERLVSNTNKNKNNNNNNNDERTQSNVKFDVNKTEEE